MSPNKSIAVLSGKGGTGKTLVAVNLAAVAQRSLYLDCDVEEPNGHLFFKPSVAETVDIKVKVPRVVNGESCSGCRRCVDFCKFNAIALVKEKPVIFPEVCHSCGGCVLFCPEGVFDEGERTIGTITQGESRHVKVLSGQLNPGEVSGTKIIEELGILGKSLENRSVFIDCPPGSACTVMESIRDADFCVFVAEPTVFGVHNLAMIYELVRLLKKPYGAVLNKCMPGENIAEQYCQRNGIPVLMKIPYDPQLAKVNGDGRVCAWESRKYRELFINLLDRLEKEADHERVIDS